MTKFFAKALPLFAAALLAGCNEGAVEEEIAPAAQHYEIPAMIVNEDNGVEEADGTRAYVDGSDRYLVKWQKNDSISFFPMSYNMRFGAKLADSYIGKTNGVFNCNLTMTVDEKSTHYGVYPHAATNSLNKQTINTLLSTGQTYRDQSFGGLNMHMTAYALATAHYRLNFQSYHGALGLRLNGNTKGFKVTIESKEETLAGRVAIATPYDVPVAERTDQSSKVVTFDCSDVQLTNEAQPFCVALLPGTYTKLRVTIEDAEGNVFFQRTASNLTIRRNLIKMMAGVITHNDVDHTQNPLLKWDEADLVYNKSKKNSHPASGYTVQGSLYQWGRNTGWSDYKDAMGNFDTNGIWDYATLNGTYKAGTGAFTTGKDHESSKYTSAEELAANPGIYFMNPNGTDYWQFGNGGSTWNERAAKCGFSGSPCPSGYHMPTKAEFLDIKPSQDLSGTGSLAEVLSSCVELKKIDGVNCAMRWTAETVNSKSYLRIDALVVKANFAEADLATIDWTDKNVVTRYFGANGSIAKIHHINDANGTFYDIARPMPRMQTHETKIEKVYKSASETAWIAKWDRIVDYSVNNEGYYWMSDAKMAFSFCDNARVKSAFANKESAFGTLSVDAQDCCSIRCVKD